MSSTPGSFSLNHPYLDSFVADQRVDGLFDMEFGSGGTSHPQEVFKQHNHFPIFPSGFYFDLSPQGTWQNTLLPLPDIPGPPSFQPQVPVMLLDSDMRNRDVFSKEEAEAGSWATCDACSSIIAPVLPLTPSLPLATTSPLDWVKVPQRDYDQGRKQWCFKPLKPISFSVGGRPGVNIREALRKEFENLDGRDDPVLQDSSGAISCRFMFPGYPASRGSCQIHALDWTRKRRPITRGKLAHEVARRLERYLRDMEGLIPDASVGTRWTIGQGSMRIDRLFLVRLVSVSKGSFQPEIWVAGP